MTAPFNPLREASDRWDRAWAALQRKDYAEFDRLTGFKMPSQDNHRSNPDGR